MKEIFHRRVNAKGQIQIPAVLQRKFGIRAGSRIAIYEEDGRIILQPITREYIHQVRGMLQDSGALKALMEDRRQERDL